MEIIILPGKNLIEIKICFLKSRIVSSENMIQTNWTENKKNNNPKMFCRLASEKSGSNSSSWFQDLIWRSDVFPDVDWLLQNDFIRSR